MTKNEELQILRDAAAKLGPHSYCGPWLTAVIPIIERDIRSDNPPNPFTPEERAAVILREAEDVLRRAKSDAAIILQQANQQLADARSIRRNATHAVAVASRDLEKLANSLS
jgi:hypothetical protein